MAQIIQWITGTLWHQAVALLAVILILAYIFVDNGQNKIFKFCLTVAAGTIIYFFWIFVSSFK